MFLFLAAFVNVCNKRFSVGVAQPGKKALGRIWPTGELRSTSPSAKLLEKTNERVVHPWPMHAQQPAHI